MWNTEGIYYFMNASFLMIIVFLGLLSSILVYSLMLSDVDGKTYEYGMLRTLGFRKPHLVTMISISSFYFSIPGLVGGTCVAAIMNIGLREIIYI